jgi:hypothetical protein
MDARRLELYELLKPALGEQPAQALVLALPAKPEELATKSDLDVRFAQMDARFDRLENLLTRRMITLMGAWTILLGTAFAWAAALLH